MPALTSKVDHLLNGVSQRAPDQRSPHHWEILENALVNVEFGVRKRPPTANLGQIAASTTGYSSAFVQVSLNCDLNERAGALGLESGLDAASEIASAGLTRPRLVRNSSAHSCRCRS